MKKTTAFDSIKITNSQKPKDKARNQDPPHIQIQYRGHIEVQRRDKLRSLDMDATRCVGGGEGARYADPCISIIIVRVDLLDER
jgi:hypothetical protein